MLYKKIKTLTCLSLGATLVSAVPLLSLSNCSATSVFEMSVVGSKTMDAGFTQESSLNFIYIQKDNKYSKADNLYISILDNAEAAKHNFHLTGSDQDLDNNKIKVNFGMDILGEWNFKFDLKFAYDASYIEGDKIKTVTVDYTVRDLEIRHHQRPSVGSIVLRDGCSAQQDISKHATPGNRFAIFEFSLINYGEYSATNVALVSIEKYGAGTQNISLVDTENLPLDPSQPIPDTLKKDYAQVYLDRVSVQDPFFKLFVCFKNDDIEAEVTEFINSLRFEMQDGRVYMFSNDQGAISIKNVD